MFIALSGLLSSHVAFADEDCRNKSGTEAIKCLSTASSAEKDVLIANLMDRLAAVEKIADAAIKAGEEMHVRLAPNTSKPRCLTYHFQADVSADVCSQDEHDQQRWIIDRP